MANDLKQHKRLVEETEVCNERDVEVELERAASPGCPDPMAEQSMVGITLPQPGEEMISRLPTCLGDS